MAHYKTLALKNRSDELLKAHRKLILRGVLKRVLSRRTVIGLVYFYSNAMAFRSTRARSKLRSNKTNSTVCSQIYSLSF